MPIDTPEHQAVPDFPTSSPYEPAGEYGAAVKAAHALWAEHLAKDDWEDLGVKDGVSLARKPNPADPNGVPIVKGVATIPNVTTDQVFATITAGGVRKLWDKRLDYLVILRRFDPSSSQFYTAMQGQLFVSGRDFTGVQLVERSHEPNQPCTVTQTSIPDDERAPEQSGKVRGMLHFGGWQFEPDGTDVKATYVTMVALNGSIPMVVVRKVAIEIPMCTGALRDVIVQHGFAPSLKAVAPGGPIPLALDNELADLANASYTARWRTLVPGTTTLIYDSEKLYGSGAVFTSKVVEGSEDAIQCTDDGAGTVMIEVKEAGAYVEVSLERK